MKTSYQLKQRQYAKIYQASERTVRTWMKKGAPLDNPHEMLETFLSSQRSGPSTQRLAELTEVQTRYRGELDPSAERQAVLAELSERLDQLQFTLMFTRDFARRYEPAKWPQIVERFNSMMGEVDNLFELAGIGEDFVAPERPRPDLAKIKLWNWVQDRGEFDAHEPSEVGSEAGEEEDQT